MDAPEGMIKHIEAELNGRHLADDVLKCTLFDENVWIPIQIALRFAPKGPNHNQDNGLAPTRRQAIIWTNDG